MQLSCFATEVDQQKAPVPMFLMAAQLPSQGCVCTPVLLVQYSRVHRSATVVFRGGGPAHRKVCWLASYACSHRDIHSACRSQHCRKSNTSSHGSQLMTQVDTYIRIKARQPAETPAGWVPKPRPAEGRSGGAPPKRLNAIF